MTQEADAKRYAYRRLAMRSHHSLEMRQALAKREYADEIIDMIIREMIQAGYLNDAEWVANYVRRLQVQRYGPQAIRIKLRSKGISEAEAEPYLEVALDSENQKELIASLLSSRYRKRDLSVYKEKQKVVAALIRKGFEMSVIFSCLEGKNSLTNGD